MSSGPWVFCLLFYPQFLRCIPGIFRSSPYQAVSYTHLTYKPQIEGKETLKAVDVAMPTHSEAIQAVLNALVDPKNGVIGSMKEIDAVGHRVVHGGEAFNKSVRIDDKVMAAIEECVPLALSLIHI